MKRSLSERWPLLRFWKFFTGVGLPLVLLPIPILGQTKTAYAAYTVLIMAVFWMTEVLPIAVTALVPIVLYPLFGIQSTAQLTKYYLIDSVQVFIGGLLVALAFEFCNLHKRIALRVMLFTGTSIGMLLLGIMLTTMFLSMWMFNTATTAMMVPIIASIVEELERSLKQVYSRGADTGDISRMTSIEELPTSSTESLAETIKPPVTIIEGNGKCELEAPPGRRGTVTFVDSQSKSTDTPKPTLMNDKLEKALARMRTMLLLSTCYASNIGGTGVITGSGTNLVAIEFLGYLDPMHYGNYASLTFATWMGFNVLPMLINIFIAWLYLQFVFLGLPNRYKFWQSAAKRQVSNSLFNAEIEAKIKKMLEDKYRALGSLTVHEIGVGILFLLVVASWVLHDPRVIPGWKLLFPKKVSISTSGLLVSILFFVIPRNGDFYTACRNRDFRGVKFQPLLEYEFAFKKFPWGVVLLLGGGYALSSGAKAAGLSAAIGKSLSMLKDLPPHLIQLTCMIIIGFITEVASNTATASIVLPILLELSQSLNIHPFYLTLPATITCSYAFMLPVATPPNAIVYAAGNMKVSDMIKTGLFMNCACILVLYATTNIYGNLFFNFNDYNYIP